MHTSSKRKNVLYSKAKALLVMMFLSIVSISVKSIDAYMLTHEALLDEILEQSKGQKKEWWKRIEIIVPTALVITTIIGTIIWKKRGEKGPSEPNTSLPQGEKSIPVKALSAYLEKSKPDALKENEGRPANKEEMRKQHEVLQRALTKAQGIFDTLDRTTVNEIQGASIENTYDRLKADVAQLAVKVGSATTQELITAAQAEALQLVARLVEVEKNETTRKKAKQVAAQKVEKATKEVPSRLAHAQATYKNAQKNAPLLGITLDTVALEGATAEKYEEAIDRAMETFKATILAMLYNKETAHSISQVLRKMFVLDNGDSLSKELDKCVQESVEQLPGYILMDEGIKELTTLKDTTKTGNDRLKAAVIVFKGAQRRVREGKQVVHDFLRYQGVQKQKELLQLPIFRADFGHTDALKALTAHMIAHPTDPLVTQLDATVIQAIVGNFSFWSDGINKDAFKKAFRDKLSSKTGQKAGQKRVP